MSFDRSSAVISTMASVGSGDQSNVTSSDSGHAARFGGGSPVGDDSFAAPTMVTGPEVELQASEDAEEGPEFAQPYSPMW